MKITHPNLVLSLGVVALLSFGAPSSAQNLIVNGGFESGGANWIVSQQNSATGITFDGTPKSGLRALRVAEQPGYINYSNSLNQAFAFETGEIYSITLFARFLDTTPGVGDYLVAVGPSGSSLGNSANYIGVPNDGVYHFFSLSIGPSAGSDRVGFSFRQTPGGEGLNLDDITMTKVSSASAPEPASVFLLLVGGATIAHRRRAKI